MTIVVFDGTKLVADSRATLRRTIHADNICKIHPMDKFNILIGKGGRVETLQAVAYSGCCDSTDEFHHSLKQYLTEDGKFYGKVDNLFDWVELKSSFGAVLPSSTALFISTDTKGNVHARKLISRGQPTLVKKLPVVIGSGRLSVGEYLLDIPNLTAVDIAAMAIGENKSCGGRMSIYNPKTGKLTFKEGLTEARKKQIAKMVSTHLLNTL